MQKLEPAKPPRRRCLDIEYRRRHRCVDQVDVVLIATSAFLSGFGIGLLFMGAA